MTSPYRELAERFAEVSPESKRPFNHDYWLQWLLRVDMALIGCVLVSAACSSTQQHHAEAESAYGAELQACVANSSNRVESDVCADKVRAKWALKDGGK